MGVRNEIVISVLLIILISHDARVCGFNIETRNETVRVFSGDAGSKFGFTVALYVDSGTSYILVGAPEANTSQPNLHQPGAVYRCAINSFPCSQIPFDTTGNQPSYHPSFDLEDKSNQWFGATLTAGPDGSILACAPRYVTTTVNLDRRLPIGQCIMKTPSGNFTTYRPCYESVHDSRAIHGRYVYCLSGMSAALNADGSWITLGAIGTYYLHGQLISFDPDETSRAVSAINKTRDAYRGYSLTTGQFNSDMELEYVVGEPRNLTLLGSVSIFTKDLLHMHTIQGGQYGEYFGYSVAVSDFDGDGYDDIAVGAPFYTQYSPPLPEMGRVYIFFQKYRHTFPSNITLDGPRVAGARFGTSLAALGDINNDDNNDLAVGAPYEDGTGVVYIYHGSLSGVRAQPAQRIRGSFPAVNPAAGFGFSVSGNLDLDNNGYPDLAVGAYGSDHVLFYRTRPVIYIDAGEVIKLEQRLINLNDKQCYPHACFRLDVCLLSRDGSRFPVQFDVYVELDASKPLADRRAFFRQDSAFVSYVNVAIEMETCEPYYAYITDDNIDKIAPITINVNYTLNTTDIEDDILPILDIYTPSTAIDQVNIVKDCGEDEICNCDLSVTISSEIDSYVFGAVTDFDLVIEVINLGEDAYAAQLILSVPVGVQFRDINATGAPHPVNCQLPNDDHDIVCDIGNPYKNEAKATYVVLLRADDVSYNATQLEFISTLYSSSVELNDTNNRYKLSRPMIADVQLQPSGNSEPGQVILSALNITERLGPEIIHIFQVTNLGPSEITTLRANISVPYTVSDDLQLIEVPEQPFLLPGGAVDGQCSWTIVHSASATHHDSEDLSTTVSLSCEAGNSRVVQCARIECILRDMHQEDAAVIQVKFSPLRNAATQTQEDKSSVNVISSLESTVEEIPYIVELVRVPVVNMKVTTAIVAEKPPEEIPIWYYAAGAAGGFILLAVFVVVLCKCGFFKRKRVEDQTQEADEDFCYAGGNQGVVDSAEPQE